MRILKGDQFVTYPPNTEIPSIAVSMRLIE
jgi:hypothetical protein